MANIRTERIKKLIEAGMTQKEIGGALGISRQRIHQLITGYKSPSHRRRWERKRQAKKTA